MKPLARLKPSERSAAVQPFVGKVCEVTYRTGTYGKYDVVVRCWIIGASWHATNGNSTGDLIIAPERPGYRFFVGDDPYNFFVGQREVDRARSCRQH